MKFGIGQGIKRLEDQRLLTGAGRYTDDVREAGAAHAFVLRSPLAHATIKSVDVTAAAARPGVLAVLTADDVDADGLGPIPCMVPLENRDGSPRHDAPKPILARGKVRHVGDPVALIVAETLAEARDAAELVDVDYDALPSVADVHRATAEGAPEIWDGVKNNICFDWESGEEAAVEAAFAKAARTARVELVNNRVVANPMEPRAALALYDAADDRSTLYTSTQGHFVIRGQLAEQVLKIDSSKLRIITPDVGGAFGMKVFLHPEPALVVWASRRLKRAVRWTSERSEGFLSDVQGRDNFTTAELAMDAEGRFLGLRVETLANLGGYTSNFSPMIPTAGTAMLVGLYTTPAAYVNVKGVFTNTVPVDAYRGAGRPEAAYLIERLVDVAGRETGLGPVEIRRRNLIPADAIPYTTALGDVYDSGDFVAVMERCMAAADWDGFAARAAQAKAAGKLCGIGMATYVERCGGGLPETADIRFNDDDTVTVLMGTQDNGQGHRTSYTQILSERLGIDAARIEIVQGDSDLTPDGLTGGSRSVPVGGAAIVGAADNIVEKGKRIAAHILETAEVDIEYGDGAFTVAGTDRRVDLFQVARAARDPAMLPDGLAPGLDEAFTRTPEAATYPNGCHICEVEIDADTGEVAIVRYTVVDDFGAIINPLLLAGQVHGGIVQGVGQALHEHTVYDAESAQLLAGSFMDYAMPRAGDVPSFDFAMLNAPCTTNPLGIKGAGEAGAVGAPPAVINALVDALAPATGIDHIDMPATPHAVWRALNMPQAAAG